MVEQQALDPLSEAFQELTDEIVLKCKEVNAACQAMKTQLPKIEELQTRTGNGAAIRAYEDKLEELKQLIENRNCKNVHNANLKRQVTGNWHAIRALKVEFEHPAGSGDPGNPNLNEDLITAVRVTGLISINPADGNEAPTYSSRSSSSSVSQS